MPWCCAGFDASSWLMVFFSSVGVSGTAATWTLAVFDVSVPMLYGGSMRGTWIPGAMVSGPLGAVDAEKKLVCGYKGRRISKSLDGLSGSSLLNKQS